MIPSRGARAYTSGIPAVDQERSARDVATRFTGEVSDHVGNVLGLAVAAEGSGPRLIGGAFRIGRIHVGVDRARLDDIDRDVPWPEIARQTASQIRDGAFRHRINRDAGTGNAFAQAAADRDHSAAIFHVLRSRLHGNDRCAHVDVPDAIQVGDRHFFETRPE